MNKEAKLALIIRDYFNNKGYTTYGEVIHKSSRCDLIAKKDEEIIAVEVKMTFSFKLLQQAEYWLDKSNYVYIVVPSVFRRKKRNFAIKVAKKFGIGVFEINKSGKIKLICDAKLNKIKYNITLYKEQQQTISSNSCNNYVTPFKLTVKKLNEFMEDKNKYVFKDLINEINHHYKSDKSAISALSKLIKDNVIDGYYFTKNGRTLILNKYGF